MIVVLNITHLITCRCQRDMLNSAKR